MKNQNHHPEPAGRFVHSILLFLYTLILPALPIAFDFIFDKSPHITHWKFSDLTIYLAGILWEVSLWLLFMFVLKRLQRSRHVTITWIGHTLLTAITFTFTTFLLIYFGYHTYFHQYPDTLTIQFISREPKNGWSILLAEASITHTASVLAILFTSIFLHFAVLKNGAFSKFKNIPSARHYYLLIITIISIPPFLTSKSPLPPITNGALVGIEYIFGNTVQSPASGLHVPIRMPLLPPPAPPPKINILIILNESLRADALESLPDSLFHSLDARTIAPFAQQRQRDSLTIVFSHAYTNATATEVSCSSWMTGLPPWESSKRFHTAPTIWDAAHAAGLRTFLLSSQDWNWCGMHAFFFGPSLRHIIDKNSFTAPQVNDLGIDDALLVDSIGQLAAQSDTPFLAVLQFNSTHWPYFNPKTRNPSDAGNLPWDGPSRSQLPAGSKERYIAAVRYTDSIQEACLRILEQKGILDHTLVLVLSDHAESIGERNLARLACFYEETVRIPFYIRLPRSGLKTESALRALTAWKDKNISLLDVAPTIFDLLGYPANSTQRSFQQGSSLLAPPADSERTLGGQTTGALRMWGQHGGYSLHGHEKFVFHTGQGAGLYDLAIDPREQHNLWSNPQRRTQALAWLRKDFSRPGRSSLCNRSQNDCPEELHHLNQHSSLPLK